MFSSSSSFRRRVVRRRFPPKSHHHHHHHHPRRRRQSPPLSSSSQHNSSSSKSSKSSKKKTSLSNTYSIIHFSLKVSRLFVSVCRIQFQNFFGEKILSPPNNLQYIVHPNYIYRGSPTKYRKKRAKNVGKNGRKKKWERLDETIKDSSSSSNCFSLI